MPMIRGFVALLLLLHAYCGVCGIAFADSRHGGAATTQALDVSSAAGVHWEFQPEGGDWKAIVVPAGGWRTQGYLCDAGTYRATITVPADAAGEDVRLVFAAVNFGAEIFAGPDADHLAQVASHVDGWVPVTADVSSVAVPGRPLYLKVTVKGRRKFMAGGKYTVPEGATWDPYLEEGILRGVRLEILPRVHIEDVFVKSRVGRLGVERVPGDNPVPPTIHPFVTVANTTDHAVPVTLQPKLSSASGAHFDYPLLRAMTVTLPAHATRTVDLGVQSWTGGRKTLWWPNVPYRLGYRAQLHNLTVALSVNRAVAHRYVQRFGFRSFEVHGSHYFLNGVRCNLRGDNQQEADFGTDAYGIRPGFGPPTPGNGGWPRAVDNLLRLNFNILRIHQIPATPYMLDVCDEQGLMLIGESPLRGSENGESYRDGHENMLRMDRELVDRDRNHPAVVIWSAANEWAEPVRDAVKVIRVEDDTRPIIADGIGDIGPDVINMEHYVDGIGGMPVRGAHPRPDRPYGETEDVWDMDSTLQGFAWMATTIRTRRLLGDADLRNYVLNNAWPNYVPGEGPGNELLEKRVKHMDDTATILPTIVDPWHSPHLVLMQRCYSPVAACDVDFDRANARSNKNGDWPVVKPRLVAGTRITRTIAVFNDEFSDPGVTLRYAFHKGADTRGPVLAQGTRKLVIPLGEFAETELPFDVPAGGDYVTLTLATSKAGEERFREDRLVFRVTPADAVDYPAGKYRLVSRLSGLPAVVTGSGSAVALGDGDAPFSWRLEYVSSPLSGDVRLIDDARECALAVEAAPGGDGVNAVERPEASNDPAQIWHLTSVADGVVTLTNRASGKLLDVYGRATTPGARIVQWANNGGDNQQWELTPK